MTTEQILGAVIILLVGVVVGGAGGQAIMRKALGMASQDDKANASTAVATAAAAAATAASTAASLSQHVGRLQESVDRQWVVLDGIRDQQTRLATAFEQFPELCRVKHEALDQRIDRIESSHPI